MPGHYSKHCRRRPCAAGPATVEAPARLFVCARCRAQVLICSCCDRGQIYCAKGCAEEVRRQSVRAAGERYQATKKGRLAHAARQCAYRAKKNDVRHQFPPRAADEVVPADAAACASQAGRRYRASWRGRWVHVEPSDLWRKQKLVTHHGSPRRPAHDVEPANAAATRFSHCHWCGRLCSPLVRFAFLRR
jgi:hypothetical protein